jgi:hypothetical protein
MGDLFQPWQIIIVFLLIIFFVIKFVVKRTPSYLQGLKDVAKPTPEQLKSSGFQTNLPQDADLPTHKFCSECGKQILRRAEICPMCGCRVPTV